jgi:hypothetical protein
VRATLGFGDLYFLNNSSNRYPLCDRYVNQSTTLNSGPSAKDAKVAVNPQSGMVISVMPLSGAGAPLED